MAGTVSTLRPAGLPSGYPAEIDANVKIRFVDDMLVNMADRSADFLKYIGGVSQFTFNNPKVEWVEDDVWTRRPTHGGLVGGGTVALVVTAQAHRYPIGTILCHVADGELVRVSAITDANTLAITRDIDNSVVEGAWGATDEVIVAGMAMSEDQAYAFRPSAIFNLPFNFAQVSHVGIQVTFRRNSTALYGLRGTDLDNLSAQTVAEQFVAIEGACLFGKRFAGTGTANPALMGGLRFYVSTTFSAQATALAGAVLTRKDIEDDLQDLYYAVGPQNVPNTVMTSAWGRRKINSFFADSERLNAGARVAGVVIDSFNTVFGPIGVMDAVGLAKDELYSFRRENVKVGHYDGLGRPQLLQLPNPSATGPQIQRAYYGDISMMAKGMDGAMRISGFSVTA